MPTAARLRPHVRLRPPRSRWVFAGVVLTAVLAVHAVIWWRLVGAAGLQGVWALLATLGLAGLLASVPAAMSTRVFGNRVPAWVTAVGFRWLGLLFYWFGLALVAEPLLWAGRMMAPSLPWGGGLAVAVMVAGTGISIFALAGARTPPVKHIEVSIANLPIGLDGFRIAQLSDLHVGNTIGREFVEAVTERVNAAQPDLVALTGDFVDGPVRALAPAVAPLGGLRSRHGTYFVTGNHEYFSGGAAWCAEFTRLGVRVLRNDHVVVEHNGAKLVVAGIDDPFANEPGHGPDLRRALAGRDPAHPVLLLAHQPTAAREAAEAGVTLLLSGHTHGGQLWPFHHVVRLVQPIVAGLARLGETWIYVSRGTGWWGPPMRLGAPNEITLLTLRRASAD